MRWSIFGNKNKKAQNTLNQVANGEWGASTIAEELYENEKGIFNALEQLPPESLGNLLLVEGVVPTLDKGQGVEVLQGLNDSHLSKINPENNLGGNFVPAPHLWTKSPVEVAAALGLEFESASLPQGTGKKWRRETRNAINSNQASADKAINSYSQNNPAQAQKVAAVAETNWTDIFDHFAPAP